jgi:hypothetical protein
MTQESAEENPPETIRGGSGKRTYRMRKEIFVSAGAQM